MHPLTAEMKATTMRTLMKSPAEFQPAFTKPIVNGEDATVELALSNSGESDGQMSP
jgi:hypothetical protein